jgi:hypothetical protein
MSVSVRKWELNDEGKAKQYLVVRETPRKLQLLLFGVQNEPFDLLLDTEHCGDGQAR